MRKRLKFNFNYWKYSSQMQEPARLLNIKFRTTNQPEIHFEDEIDSFSFLNCCCFVVRRMPFRNLICPEVNIPSKWTTLSFKIRYSIKGFSIPCRWCNIYVLRIRTAFFVVAKSEHYTPQCVKCSTVLGDQIGVCLWLTCLFLVADCSCRISRQH